MSGIDRNGMNDFNSVCLPVVVVSVGFAMQLRLSSASCFPYGHPQFRRMPPLPSGTE